MPGEFDSADTVSVEAAGYVSLVSWPQTTPQFNALQGGADSSSWVIVEPDWRDRRIADLERQIEELKDLLERQRVAYHPANSWVCDGRCARCPLSACPKVNYTAPVDNLPRLFSALDTLSDEALRLSDD